MTTPNPVNRPRALNCQSRLRVALGTFVAVDAQASDPSRAERGIGAAFNAVATVERLMHPTRRGSDLAALAECPPGRPIVVHPWTFEVLELSQRLNALSRGLFDPCLDLAPGRMTDLRLGPGYTIVPRAWMRIDLGGIAKGFAVDRAVDALRDVGCEGGLVNAGGDLAVFGESRHEIYCRASRVGVGASVMLLDAALATSDTRESARTAEHRGYYHGTDRSAPVSGAVAVMAPRAAIADALTKCLLLGAHALNPSLLASYGATQINV